MVELPSWMPPSNTGAPIPKPSRHARKVAKAVQKRAEDEAVVAATKPKRKGIGARLRAMVMERDGFKCVACGATAMSDTLAIDHIIPVCQGGTNSEENLRVLCSTCNAGKGGRRVVVDPPPPKPELTEEARAWHILKDKEVKAVVKGVKRKKVK